MRDGRVESVSFVNVPACAEYLDTDLDAPDLGKLRIEVASVGIVLPFSSQRMLIWKLFQGISTNWCFSCGFLQILPLEGHTCCPIDFFPSQASRELITPTDRFIQSRLEKEI